MLLEELQLMSVQELDDLYYHLHDQGTSLIELKNVRVAQENKLRVLPLPERKQLMKQIQDRYNDTMLAGSARRMLTEKRG